MVHLKKGAFPQVSIFPSDVCSVISIDGKLVVAQEIIAIMTANFSFQPSVGGIPSSIGNILNVLIDNQGAFTGNGSSNLFRLNLNGVYSVNMSFPIVGTNGRGATYWTVA